MRKEYQALLQNDTWELVDRPNAKVLSNKWVFKKKKNPDGMINKFKARLVARGDEQRKGVDFEEVFAPVARYDVIRALLASAVEKEMHVHHVDVTNAYVQGELMDCVYMKQPEMFVVQGNENKVCKLNKPLYGLKQAGRNWYLSLSNYLTSIGMKNTQTNPCIYVKEVRNVNVILVLYVDDILIASESLQEITNLKQQLKRKFLITDLGEVTNILGMSIERECNVGPIKLSQRKYIEDTLERFGLKDCKPVSTPLVPNEKFNNLSLDESEVVRNVPYRELLGALIYISNATRPDIAYAANVLSQYNESPKRYHWKAAKHVLRYLKNTLDYRIEYTVKGKPVEVYVDADWAADETDRRSRTGYVSIVAGGPISWSSRKQKSVALSTMEAEYMALSEATKEVTYLKRLFSDLKQSDIAPKTIGIYCDNQSAIELSKNNTHHSRSKHIDIRFHYCREMCEKGEISVRYLSTHQMIADMLTKPLAKPKLNVCVNLLNMQKRANCLK